MNRTGSSIARGIVCAAIILCCAGVLWSVEFAGGTGEPNNPYQIATAEQLVAIGSDPDLGQKDFVLVADIDLSFLTPWSEPVIPVFGGTLDGNGHAIQGLVARGVEPLGLLGQITDNGRVMHLRMVDVDLTGVSYVGALAAYNAGAVHDCGSTGIVISTGQPTGGLIGYNTGIVTGSFSTAWVTGNSLVGGLVGTNARGVLADCHSTAVVLGYSYVGGLVGNSDGSISGCYADGEVTGASGLGGLLGSNLGLVSWSYSAGAVAGGDDAGGLVGYNQKTISSSYSVAEVTSHGKHIEPHIGGLVGRVANLASVVRDSYFLAPADGGGPDNEIGTPLTAAQMEQQASFADWDFWGSDADDTADRWFMPAGAPPVLAWQTEITGLKLVPDVTGLPLERARAALATAGFVAGSTSYDYDRVLLADFVIHAGPATVAAAGATIDLVLSTGTVYDWADNPGDGTEANPYQIQTAGQLESLGGHPELWDRQFVLTADMDMAGRTYATALIAPDTSRIPDSLPSVAFTGVFDGQGHTIRGLTILGDEREYLGLFGVVGPTGRVRDLNLREATVKTPTSLARPTRSSPTTYVGILAGCNEGTIAGCSATESLLIGLTSGNGLVGTNRGSVVDCQADIVVVGSTSTTVTR